MKSVFRKTVMAALMATVAFVPGLSTHAQGSNCYGLNADDCALAQSALNSSDATKLTSFVLDYSVSGSATGTASDGSFKITGMGPLGVDTSKASSTSGSMGSLGALTMQNTIQGSLTTNGTTMNDNIEARVLNGTLYFKDDMMTKGAWQSLDLTTAAGAAMSNPMVGGMLGGMGGMGGTGSTGSTGLPGMNNPMMTALSNPDTLQSLMKALQTPGFITATRGADATSNGETFAAFVFNIDIPTLLKSPDFKPALQSIMKAQGSSSMTDQQINQMIVAGGAMLQGVKLTFTEYVGATDKLPHGVAINLAAHFDAATAALINPSSTSNTPIDIAFNLDVKLSKIGQPVTVEAVTGATPLDLSGMGGGMMGGAATPSAQ